MCNDDLLLLRLRDNTSQKTTKTTDDHQQAASICWARGKKREARILDTNWSNRRQKLTLLGWLESSTGIKQLEIIIMTQQENDAVAGLRHDTLTDSMGRKSTKINIKVRASFKVFDCTCMPCFSIEHFFGFLSIT